ncbi:MAG: archaellin/type IV pilin N-terminal domain-containing protein [Thermoplasmatota archaeon]
MKRINRKQDEEEGAMGVGTLIVFIAMVLVAAVAASVLIDTANKLQQQAQKTGDQAIREVSTAFMVKDTFIEKNESSDEYTNITMKIGLAAGAPAQNLEQTMIQIDDGTNEIVFNGTQLKDNATEVIKQGDSEIHIIEQGDTVKLDLNVTDSSAFDEPLNAIEPQDEITIRIIPKHGTPTLETFMTPPVMQDTYIHVA